MNKTIFSLLIALVLAFTFTITASAQGLPLCEEGGEIHNNEACTLKSGENWWTTVIVIPKYGNKTTVKIDLHNGNRSTLLEQTTVIGSVPYLTTVSAEGLEGNIEIKIFEIVMPREHNLGYRRFIIEEINIDDEYSPADSSCIAGAFMTHIGDEEGNWAGFTVDEDSYVEAEIAGDNVVISMIELGQSSSSQKETIIGITQTPGLLDEVIVAGEYEKNIYTFTIKNCGGDIFTFEFEKSEKK